MLHIIIEHIEKEERTGIILLDQHINDELSLSRMVTNEELELLVLQAAVAA